MDAAVRRRQFAAERLPVVVKLAAELADARRAEAVALGQLAGAVALRHVLGDIPVSRAQRGQPRGEVEAESYLLRDRGAGVVLQRLRQRVAVERAEVGQTADLEAVPALGRGRHRVLRLAGAGQAAAVVNRAGGEGGQDGG